MADPAILFVVAGSALATGLTLGFAISEARADRRERRAQRARDLAAVDYQRRRRAFQRQHQQIVPGAYGPILGPGASLDLSLPLDRPDHAADLSGASPAETLPWPVRGVSRNPAARNRAGGTSLGGTAGGIVGVDSRIMDP